MIINVFTNENCVPCRFTKRWLNKNGFNYTELKVTDYADILRDQGYSSAPVVSIIKDNNEEVTFSGYSPNKLQEHLLQQV